MPKPPPREVPDEPIPRPGPKPRPTPAPESFPDPWPPLIALHLYGCNLDLESLEQSDPIKYGGIRSTLEQVLIPLLYPFIAPATVPIVQPKVRVEYAYDPDYVSVHGVMPVISIGAWEGTRETPGHDARLRGLRAARTTDRQNQSGEAQVKGSIIANLIRSYIPETLEDKDHNQPVANSRVSMTVDAVAPVGFSISATYGVDIPGMGYQEITASSTVTLTASQGDLALAMPPVQFSANLWNLLFNPLAWMEGLVGSLVILYMIIQRIGSNQSVPATFGSIDGSLSILDGNSNLLAGVSLRNLLIGPFRAHLTYQNSSFVGLVSETSVIRVPFGFTLAFRTPAVTIQGSSSVVLHYDMEVPGGPAIGALSVSAVTSDFAQPAFAWTINGQPAGNGAHPVLQCVAPRGTPKLVFTVEVTATDRTDATITASALLRVTGSIQPRTVPRTPSKPLNEPDPGI